MVNCDTYEMKWISYTGYAGHMGKGTIVSGSNIPDKDFTKFPEGSVFGTVLKEACNLLD